MTKASDIDDQAARWLSLRDSGVPVDMEFTRWLASDPRHRAAYLRMSAGWERAHALRRLSHGVTDIDPDFIQPSRRRRFRPLRVSLYALAASVVIGLAIALNLSMEDRSSIYETAIGDIARVVLMDGSSLTLNTDSKARVRYTRARRSIEMLRGEARFAVSHDVTRPFDVLVGGSTVRAIGTNFDVRLQRTGLIRVIVAEGRVSVGATAQIDKAGRFASLSGGEVADSDAAGVVVRQVGADEIARELAWEKGELVFTGQELRDVVGEFNRYNRRQLRLDDPSLATLHIGGWFETRDPDSFVASLRESFGIVVVSSNAREVALGREPAGSAPGKTEVPPGNSRK